MASAQDQASTTVGLGQRFVEAVVGHDWAAVAACFATDAEFRALVPTTENPFRQHSGGAAASDQIRRWFGDADVMELLDSSVEVVADRVRIAYRIREHEPDGWYEVEQIAFVTPGDQGFRFMNLVCSGFRPRDD